MTWNLFIDDERFPPDDGREWKIARNGMDVLCLVHKMNSIPSFISFDHDLGEDVMTGLEIAKMLVDCDIEDDFTFPENFDYYVHSQNPIGKANIEGYLNSYLKMKKEC